MSGPYACTICPRIRRALCLLPCTPEIAAQLAKLHQEQDERELVFRFTRPVRPARVIRPFFREGSMARSARHESPDKLR